MDAASLSNAGSNLLRQTASAFYIGEIRDDADWEQALFLAGTGHLIVTTTHGDMVDSLLEKREGVVDNEVEHTEWVDTDGASC